MRCGAACRRAAGDACIDAAFVQDLGCIEYVFSDKTGTLTRNKMRFAHAYVACGQVFNEAASPGSMAAGAAHAAPADALVITRFLRILAVCHTAVPERIGEEGTLVCVCTHVQKRSARFTVAHVAWLDGVAWLISAGTTPKAPTSLPSSQRPATTDCSSLGDHWMRW